LYQLNQPHGFSSFFGLVRFTSAQLGSSPPFPLPGVTSPLADVVTPPRCVTLPFHWVKMSLLPPLHLLVMLCPVAYAPELKLKYWIYTTSAGYPLGITRLLSTPTQSRLHFASSLARAPHHRCSTHRRLFLSPLSHAYHPSAQWHPRWWPSRPSFASRIIYRYVNSCKKIFWNVAASCGVTI
jgi:hypothetical protein